MSPRTNSAAIALALLGLLQVIGHTAGLAGLAHFAQATMASPAPRPFAAVGRLEPFASRYSLEWLDAGKRTVRVRLTPELAQRLSGPAVRREMLWSAIGSAATLASPDRDAVLRAAFCGDAPVLSELGIDRQQIAARFRVRLEPWPARSGYSRAGPFDYITPPCP